MAAPTSVSSQDLRVLLKDPHIRTAAYGLERCRINPSSATI